MAFFKVPRRDTACALSVHLLQRRLLLVQKYQCAPGHLSLRSSKHACALFQLLLREYWLLNDATSSITDQHWQMTQNVAKHFVNGISVWCFIQFTNRGIFKDHWRVVSCSHPVSTVCVCLVHFTWKQVEQVKHAQMAELPENRQSEKNGYMQMAENRLASRD